MWTHRTSESLMLEKISKILKSNLWHQPFITQSRALNATSSHSLTPLRPWAASSKFITKDRSSHLFQTPLFEDGNVPGSLWQNLSAVTHPTPEIVREVSPGEVCSCSGRQFITCRRNVTVYLVSAQIIHVSPPTFLFLWWNIKMVFGDKMQCILSNSGLFWKLQA